MADEHEELEQLKKWWSENGRTVVVGLVLGLGGVFGWNAWQAHLIQQAETASMRYELIVDYSSADDHGRVRAEAAGLRTDFPDSGYSALASLLAARSAVADKELEEAKAHLQWAIDNADVSEVGQIARLRLARVLLGDSEFDGALAELERIDMTHLAAAKEELRGDVLLGKGDRDGARAAYSNALSSAELPAASRARIRMKLDDLGELGFPTAQG